MIIIANVIGIIAVAMFVLSYQFKSRRWIIFFNGGSRILYVLQYILLGAFEGVVFDVVALVITLLAQQKDRKYLKNHSFFLVTASNIFIVVMGLVFYKNIFSLLPVLGVIFETGALWLTKEKQIRIVSFFGAPFWLAYNLVFVAYGSAVGNIMTMVSIGLAIYRYDISKNEDKL